MNSCVNLLHFCDSGYTGGMTQPLHVGLVFDYNLAYSRGVLRGIKQFAQTRPHWILMPLDTEGLTSRVLKTMQPAGLIPLVATSALAKTLRSSRKPLVNVGGEPPDLSLLQVIVNHQEVGQLAAHHLRERVFHHFGFVGHPHHFYSTEREAGFRQALDPARHSLACYHERPARSYRQRGQLFALNAGLHRWLRGLPKPVGIFA